MSINWNDVIAIAALLVFALACIGQINACDNTMTRKSMHAEKLQNERLKALDVLCFKQYEACVRRLDMNESQCSQTFSRCKVTRSVR